MNITIRTEREEDRRKAEELTREAFWNIYIPGCAEHCILHRLRASADFLPELALCAFEDEELVGHIIYTRSVIKGTDGATRPAVTFGPVSAAPSRQKRGIGSMLVRRSMQTAAELGHSAVIIYGDPAYYERFGFKNAKAFGIHTPDGQYPKGLLAAELVPGALAGAGGAFFPSPDFEVTEEEVAAFDTTFPAKEKLVTESQKAFARMTAETV